MFENHSRDAIDLESIHIHVFLFFAMFRNVSQRQNQVQSGVWVVWYDGDREAIAFSPHEKRLEILQFVPVIYLQLPQNIQSAFVVALTTILGVLNLHILLLQSTSSWWTHPATFRVL